MRKGGEGGLQSDAALNKHEYLQISSNEKFY